MAGALKNDTEIDAELSNIDEAEEEREAIRMHQTQVSLEVTRRAINVSSCAGPGASTTGTQELSSINASDARTPSGSSTLFLEGLLIG